MKLLIFVALLATAFAQDYEDTAGYVEPTDTDQTVEVTLEWPQNDNATAGAIVAFAYAGLEDGSCTVQLPIGDDGKLPLLVHFMNAHVVPDESSPAEGRYRVAAPADWEAVNGTINVLVIFDRDGIFNLSLSEFRCDEEVAELSVYSFPQNILQKEASSNVFYRPGFHVGDTLTITLEYDVKRFNITGADSRWEITKTDRIITVTNFQNVAEDKEAGIVGVDDQKEVHFSLEYATDWFSAASIGVGVESGDGAGGDTYEP